jgi:hypothetical protein
VIPRRDSESWQLNREIVVESEWWIANGRWWPIQMASIEGSQLRRVRDADIQFDRKAIEWTRKEKNAEFNGDSVRRGWCRL